MGDMQMAWQVAEKAWAVSSNKSSVAKKQCTTCFDIWKSNGRIKQEKPPLFPPDFEGKCPSCNGELSRPFVPF